MDRLKKLGAWVGNNLTLVLSLVGGALFLLWRGERNKRIEAETEKDIVEKQTEIKQIKKEVESAETEYDAAKDDYARVSRKHRDNGDGQ